MAGATITVSSPDISKSVRTNGYLHFFYVITNYVKTSVAKIVIVFIFHTLLYTDQHGS